MGTVELEPEVTAWLDGLADDESGHVERYIDLLAHQGALLGAPFTRQLDGKLRELRFYLGRQQTGIRPGREYEPGSTAPGEPCGAASTKATSPWRRVDPGHAHDLGRDEGLRADSSERRRGYDSAARAIRLAFEIRTPREKKGLSQRQLAGLVGTTQSAIARLEGGRISPSLPTLDRIAAALGAEVTVTISVTAELAR